MRQFQQVDTPAKIGIVADTHRSSGNPQALPQSLTEGLKGCDLILHAGDINAPWVIDVLNRIAPVVAVSGNNDEPQVLNMLPTEVQLQAGDYRIGLLHGHLGRNNALTNAVDRMESYVDIIVFGHSHMPVVKEHNGLLLVNPGSPTQRRKAPHRSFAIMDIGNEVKVDIVELDVG